ncbi:MAG: AAA family ATPase [Dehalococcoidales bacterium]|nr:MAG: AAA family ATPase [Dehalococcoidales bacterium]
MPVELTAEQVRERCDPNLFECDSTAELTPADSIIGQERALSALKFGLNIQKPGFNIYVAGPAGTGKATVIKSFLEALAAEKETPPDLCYVHNFHDPYCPRALKIPAGMGLVLQKDMKHAIENARKSLVQAFGSKEYEEQRSEIAEEQSRKRETAFNAISEKAKEKGLLLKTTQVGLILMPASQGETMSEEEYQNLSASAKEELANARDELGKELKDIITELQADERTIQQKLEDSDHEVANYAIGHTFQELNKKYEDLPQVVAYLDEVERNIIENYEQFKSEPAPQGPDLLLGAVQEQARKRSLQNYEVNVVVDNSALKGAPAVLELNPTFNNLFGLIEKEAQFGALYTDFTMIRGGSLHNANGGYLALRIEDLLTNFQSWEGLKRTLRDEKLAIEEVAERLGFAATKTLRPEPIPLDIKVVIIGEPMFYYLLLRADLQFQELFKVKADFDSQMDKNEACLKQYASVICRLCQEEDMKHLKSDALARIIEHSSRLAGDRNKLSTLFANIADIIREANFWAGEDDTGLIEAEHIEKAVEQRVYRSNLIQQRINEMIETSMIKIESEGEGIGEVNGLAVIDLGDFAFGRPSRITASVSVGREGLIDIEREAKLGGPLHTKGVMILNGYIHDRYARDIPLSLSARLVFEQSYEEVDGDSASSTELYSLLSCLSGVPIKRGIAVTGSVNQKGEVQAIGGINEKIEGFFEICRTKGLNGHQGVLIPASNIRNLMLKDAVADAIKEGQFHIYPVNTIDEGMEVLTEQKAGQLLEDGNFEPGSINDLVQKRLISLAEKLRDFSKGEENQNGGQKSSDDS